MKNIYTSCLIILSSLSFASPLYCAPESSKQIQVTELPIGNRGVTQPGKMPFKLVPVDPQEGLPEERVSSDNSKATQTTTPEGSIIKPNLQVSATSTTISPSGQALPAQSNNPIISQEYPGSASSQATAQGSWPGGKKLPTTVTPGETVVPNAVPRQAPMNIAQPEAPQQPSATAPEAPTKATSITKAVEPAPKPQATKPSESAKNAPQVQPVIASVKPQEAVKGEKPAATGAAPQRAQSTMISDIHPAATTPTEQLPETNVVATPAAATEKKDTVKQVPMKQPTEGSHRLVDRRKKKAGKSLAEAPVTGEEAKSQMLAIEEEQSGQGGLEQTREAFEKLTETGGIHLGQYLEPWKGFDPNELVEMNFDNKELTELLRFLSNTFDVTFITDDAIEPLRAEGLQPMAGTKITFKSSVPLTLQQAWEIGLTFIEMAGFSVIPSTQPRTYRVTVSASRDKPSANREPLPTFIGTDPELIPNNDTKIRYVYFAENAELATIIQIIEAMKSGSAGPLIEVTPLRAVIMTDKAANIRSLVAILQEIDRVTLPETLAIIRLRHTDARQVRELYHKLIGKDPQSAMFNPFTRQRKSPTTQYFTEATRVFEEPYTNSLIVLGTRENIKRFEDFILKYVDKTLDIPFSPLHVIQLKYMDAASIAKILNEIIQKFNADPANTAAALVGGVRDTNKFFRPTVRITEETSGNRLIINADYDEYLKIRELIEKLDVEQPQVAVKILILDVDLTNTKQIGTQLRNKVDCCDGTGGLDTLFGRNVNWQTSMLGPIVTQQPASGSSTPVNGAERLLGNLINLANLSSNGVAPFGVGSTLITLGQDLFGFWGLLLALESYTRVSVVANPFLVVTNKYKAEFKVGETRRTTTALVEGQREAQAQGDLSADLRVIVTPQISFDDMITLNVYVELGQFVNTTTENRIIKRMSTEALLANREVLALGGLIRDNITETTEKVPILGDIPLLGFFFKSKTKTLERTSLLILICPEIIKPYEPEVAQNFTYSKIADVKDNLYSMRSNAERRDPIHRWFFGDNKDKEASYLDKFVSTQQRYIDESQKKTEVIAQKKQASPSKKGLLDLVPSKTGARA